MIETYLTLKWALDSHTTCLVLWVSVLIFFISFKINFYPLSPLPHSLALNFRTCPKFGEHLNQRDGLTQLCKPNMSRPFKVKNLRIFIRHQLVLQLTRFSKPKPRLFIHKHIHRGFILPYWMQCVLYLYY